MKYSQLLNIEILRHAAHFAVDILERMYSDLHYPTNSKAINYFKFSTLCRDLNTKLNFVFIKMPQESLIIFFIASEMVWNVLDQSWVSERQDLCVPVYDKDS